MPQEGSRDKIDSLLARSQAQRHLASPWEDKSAIAMTSHHPTHVQDLAPELRLSIWEAYFNIECLAVKTCSRRPGLYIVEPGLLLTSKALREEALKPYLWRLRRDLMEVLGELEGCDGRKDPSSPLSPPWHKTELRLQAETLRVEIGRVEGEVERKQDSEGV